MKFEIQDMSLLDEIGPEQVILINNPSIGLKGVLSIDNSVYGIPAGGVRLAPDITVDEIVRLSRAMSLKFCAYRLKVGGAKSGVLGNPLDDNKGVLLTGFAKAIGTYVKNDVYYPGPDMGTDDNDLVKMFSVMGVPNLAPNKIGLFKEGIPVEELFTGYGVIDCLEVIYNNIDKLTRLKQVATQRPKILLEGFGKVGTAIAMSLKDKGYLLTGVSTIKGAIYDDDGLNIDELLRLKLEYGDDLVNEYSSKNLMKIPKEKLFELSSEFKTDFIIPGARPDVINKQNVDNIETIALVPAANIPYEKGITSILAEKGIIAFPDFVANAGEVLAVLVNKVAKDCNEIFDYIKSKISEKTFHVIQEAYNERITPYDYAVNDALNELKKKIKRKVNLIEKLNKRFK
ncbi:MAG: Glu/Leu/Phe/Val dehydrogenase [Candidatus Lokiarchaeota archaeon]|nr:Glu/Leu/Phe/Val dehydrogenase [Candidatus Lokiarchaeota archaeon]